MVEFGRIVRPGDFAVALLVIALSVLTVVRNEGWKTDLGLWIDNISKSPQKARPHYHIGVILLEADRTEEAKMHFYEAVRLKTDYAEAYVNLGKSYVRLQDYQRAKDFFRTALLFSPKNVQAHFNLGVLYLEEGMDDDAAREFEAVLRVEPRHALASQFLAHARKSADARSRQQIR